MSKYLKEDEDIIAKMAGQSSLETLNLLNRLQIEATLRNRKSLVSSSKETRIFSLVLIVFALIQFIVALFQFLFSVQTSNNKWYGLFLVIALFIVVGYIFKKFGKLK